MRREIRPLTGLRGIAALWVVACHWSGIELSGLARDIALHGYVAVDLFMILSGFVLAMTNDETPPRPPLQGYGGFLWRRICRLYPLYVLTTLVCLIEAWATGEGLFESDKNSTGSIVAALASNLLMTDTHLWDVDAIDGPSWVVSVEFTLNLAFPLFMILCMRPSRRVCVALASLAAVALVAVSLLDHRLNAGVPGALGTLDTRLMYLRCGPEFALGMYCWRFRDHAAVFGRTAPLAVVMLALLLMTPFKSLDLLFVAASCLLVIGLAAERSSLAALLGTPIPCWLGRISYSLYLWHAAFIPSRPILVAVLGLTDPRLALMAANTINLALVLGFSTLSYRWFEEPAREWLRRRMAPPDRAI